MNGGYGFHRAIRRRHQSLPALRGFRMHIYFLNADEHHYPTVRARSPDDAVAVARIKWRPDSVSISECL